MPSNYISGEVYNRAHLIEDGLSRLATYYSAGPFPETWNYDGESRFEPLVVENVEKYSNTYNDRLNVYKVIVGEEDQYINNQEQFAQWTRCRKAPFILIIMLRNAYKYSPNPVACVQAELIRMTHSSKATMAGYYWMSWDGEKPGPSAKSYIALKAQKTRALSHYLKKHHDRETSNLPGEPRTAGQTAQ